MTNTACTTTESHKTDIDVVMMLLSSVCQDSLRYNDDGERKTRFNTLSRKTNLRKSTEDYNCGK